MGLSSFCRFESGFLLLFFHAGVESGEEAGESSDSLRFRASDVFELSRVVAERLAVVLIGDIEVGVWGDKVKSTSTGRLGEC